MPAAHPAVSRLSPRTITRGLRTKSVSLAEPRPFSASTLSVPPRSIDMVRRSFLALAVALLVAPVYSAELEIGAHAPEFKALIGVDGKEYSLGDMKDAKAVVVCFTCNNCPVAVAYEDRFVEFQKKYAAKGVKFVAIN